MYQRTQLPSKQQFISQPSSTQSQSQSQNNIKTKQDKSNALEQISVLKRAKISNYPYYPVTFTMTQNQLNYTFSVDFNIQQASICITPFKYIKQKRTYTQFSNTFISLEGFPRKNINYVNILEYQDFINSNGKSVTVKFMDFVVGFACGFLIRCRYTNSVKPQVAGSDKRQLNIVGKFNKKPNQGQGILMRMSNTFFGSQQFYKVAVQKPVRSFLCHRDRLPSKSPSTQKYNYSYLIGNRLYLCTQFSQQIQSQTLRSFSQVPWQTMPNNTSAKLNNKFNSLVINTKRHKTLITSSSMLIEWQDEITTYVYTKNNEIIIADNQQNKILIFDVIDNLKLKSSYKFDLDIKKITYVTPQINGKQQILLLIMPYNNNLYILNITQNMMASFKGHHSYITQAILNYNGYLITGGCDHRIALTDIRNVKYWTKIQSYKPINNNNTVIDTWTKYYNIQSQSVPVNKMADTYFLGEFNNVNSERNNNNDYGFGNFLPFGDKSQLYAFLTFDFLVKIYQIIV